MSVERFDIEHRPSLARGGDWLQHGLLTAVGHMLLALAVLGWLSLATGSAQDPSLTHATSGLTRNWLGPIGAIVSDLLLQTLGFCAIFVFLGLAVPGYELAHNARIDGLRLRLGLFPLSIVVLAGAFGAVPAPSSWPVNHGLGGIIGDIVFGTVSGLLAIINPGRAGAASGLVLFAGGMCLLSSGLGLGQREWSLLWQRSPQSARASGVGVLSGLKRWLARRRTPVAAEPEAVVAAAPLAPRAAAMHGPVATTEPYEDVAAPADLPPPSPPPPRPYVPMRAPEPAAPHAERRPTGFEDETESTVSGIARTFAPNRERNAPPQPRPATQIIKSLFGHSEAPEGAYRRPSLNLLKRAAATRPGAEFTQPVLRGSARLLEDVLNDFGVKGEVKDIRPGPVVTLFEFEPARGIKTSRVVALADDVARSMSAASARIAAIPGRNVLGIELPNVRRETVQLRELLEVEAWRSNAGHLPIVLGKAIGGEPVIADLSRMPHLLVAGTTGSGKSVGVNAMLLSLLFRLGPEDCRLLLIDPKMLELSVYNGIPHLLAPVVTDPHRAAAALQWAVTEMEERYKRMSHLGVRNIEMFNNRVRNARKRGEPAGRSVQTGYDPRTGEPIYVREQLDDRPMPYIVIVVDEFADLMVVAGKEIEGAVQRLAQMARAAGIHLVMATQRPSVDVVTGTIKANFPTRIAFKVASKIDSRTILNEQGAEQLLGAGDMLYAPGAGSMMRVHGPFVADDEVERVAAELRTQGEPQYVPDLMRDPPPAGTSGNAGAAARDAGDDVDDLFDRAVAVVHRDQKASTSYLQRRLGIGYNRAADLIERMEREGLVSPADAVGRRRILTGGDAADLHA
jgi:S-DNA-T family DNA segregation ATPase FtsK/SpoIIIE